MLLSPKLVAPERVSRGVGWVFVVLLGAAVIASIGYPGGAQVPTAQVANPGVVESSLAHGVAMLVAIVETTWRQAVQELAKVVIAVLDFHWWPLQIVMQWQDLSGGAHVLHS